MDLPAGARVGNQRGDLRPAQALNAAAAPRDAQCEGVSAPGMTRSPANVRYPGARQLAASAPPRGAGPQPGASITT